MCFIELYLSTKFEQKLTYSTAVVSIYMVTNQLYASGYHGNHVQYNASQYIVKPMPINVLSIFKHIDIVNVPFGDQ